MTDKERPLSGNRNRGVRASRAKLVHALREAGFKTQAALAERIADLEGLDSPPKDLVNRAFRELPVDPQTLDRIASALNAEAPTLYKTSEETTSHSPESHSKAFNRRSTDVAGTPAPDGEPNGANRQQKRWIAPAFAIAVLLGIGWITNHLRDGSNDESAPQNSPLQSNVLPLGPTSMVVMPIDGDNELTFTTELRNALSKSYQVATATALATVHTQDLQEIAEELRVDLVIFGEIQEVRGVKGVRLFASAPSGRQQIWASSIASNRFESNAATIAQNTVLSLQHITGEHQPGKAPYFPSASIQDDYLQGLSYLDKPTSELHIKRAQSRFSSALRQDPLYAKAHAGLCIALLEEFWMEDEERALDDASRTCGEARALDPRGSEVTIAHAYFLRRSGQNDEAIEQLKQLIETEPDNAVALDGLASALLDSYRQEGNEEQLSRAIEMAVRSVEANPNVWRPYNTLLSLQWFAGNIEGAIEAAERSIEIEENELILVNLGTMNLCSGRIDQSRTAYERAIEIAPDSYIGKEFLGQAMYFLGDFKRSTQLRRTAIESIGEGEPEIHEMWGNLGDSYRQTGDAVGAIGAYLQASKIAERDHVRGNAAIADRASRAYYYTMLRQLDRDTVADDVYNQMLSELDDITTEVTETSALRRLAQTWLALGESVKAKETLARVTNTCPGYAKMPDFAPLLATQAN